MNTIKCLGLIAISLTLTVGLFACDKQNPAETAGKKIDQAVEKAGQKMDEASKKMGEQSDKVAGALEDTEITVKAKAAILAEPGLKVLQINVDTAKGIVTLSGSVDSQQNSNRAKEIAGAVAGAREVDNRLVVKAPS